MPTLSHMVTKSFRHTTTNEDKVSKATETPLLRRALRARLLTLDLPSFARCVELLLGRIGYADVHSVSRRVTKVGVTGGYDLTTSVRVGPHRRPVIVRLKQYDQEAVSQRMVDELRGACLRSGAAEAMLVTTSDLSPVIRRDLVQSSPVAPVRLLDGETLLDLLITHRIGVRETERVGGRRPLVLDAAFFDRLLPATLDRAIVQRSAKTARMVPRGNAATKSASAGGHGRCGYGSRKAAPFLEPSPLRPMSQLRVTVEVSGSPCTPSSRDSACWHWIKPAVR
jgi:hypothetical protein